MSQLLKEQKVFLMLILKSRNLEQAKHVISAFGSDQLRAIFEICANILYFNIPISEYYKKKLKPHASVLMKLSSKSVGIRNKKLIVGNNTAAIVQILRSVKDRLI